MKKISIPLMIMLFALLAACGGEVVIDPEALATQAAEAVSNVRDAVDGDEEETVVEEEHTVHWDYEGEDGPAHWGELKNDYAVCGTGREQSPVDLGGYTQKDLENITFNYQETDITILNNGHTIQVNYDTGSSIEIEGQTYNLLQFHFHSPSEHTVNSRQFPLEMHLVHQDADGNLAVVGLFIQEGTENAAFTPVWDNLPSEETEAIATGMRVNAADFLPPVQNVYSYAGSLTTPPCDQDVVWSVMDYAIEMSRQQIDDFSNIINGNNRPVQPLNDRDVLLDSTP